VPDHFEREVLSESSIQGSSRSQTNHHPTGWMGSCGSWEIRNCFPQVQVKNPNSDLSDVQSVDDRTSGFHDHLSYRRKGYSWITGWDPTREVLSSFCLPFPFVLTPYPCSGIRSLVHGIFVRFAHFVDYGHPTDALDPVLL